MTIDEEATIRRIGSYYREAEINARRTGDFDMADAARQCADALEQRGYILQCDCPHESTWQDPVIETAGRRTC